MHQILVTDGNAEAGARPGSETSMVIATLHTDEDVNPFGTKL